MASEAKVSFLVALGKIMSGDPQGIAEAKESRKKLSEEELKPLSPLLEKFVQILVMDQQGFDNEVENLRRDILLSIGELLSEI